MLERNRTCKCYRVKAFANVMVIAFANDRSTVFAFVNVRNMLNCKNVRGGQILQVLERDRICKY